MRSRLALVLAACLAIGLTSSSALGQSPGKRGSNSETLEDIEILVRVPKPEAQIFTPKMKTRYESLSYEKSFLKDIIDSVKQGPF